jgi:DNA-binding response OmpR family regulator
MNGEELIPRILVLRPGMPVLRMSGYPQRSGIQLKTGTPYLQKPFSPAELLNRIRILF